MNKKIETLFLENEFVIFEGKDKLGNEICFHKDEKEYFLLKSFSKDAFMSFFSCEETKGLINYFDSLKLKYSNAEKNTSLILFVEVDNLKDMYESIENQILAVEEDEYFFRKYVVVYSCDMIDNIPSSGITNFLMAQIKEGNIDNFRKNKFGNRVYFLAIQLFVKLPFLSYSAIDTEFKPIQNILEAKLIDLKEVDKLFENITLMTNETTKLFLLEKSKDEELFQEYQGVIK